MTTLKHRSLLWFIFTLLKVFLKEKCKIVTKKTSQSSRLEVQIKDSGLI